MWQQNLGDGKAASRKTAPTYGGSAGAVGRCAYRHESIIPGRLANPENGRALKKESPPTEAGEVSGGRAFHGRNAIQSLG